MSLRFVQRTYVGVFVGKIDQVLVPIVGSNTQSQYTELLVHPSLSVQQINWYAYVSVKGFSAIINRISNLEIRLCTLLQALHYSYFLLTHMVVFQSIILPLRM